MADEELEKQQASPEANTSVDPLSGALPPTPNQEDELLKSAGEGLSEEETAPAATPTVAAPKKKRSPKKVLIFLLIIIVLAGVALALRMFVFKQKAAAPDKNGTTQTSEQQKKEQMISYDPDSVAYAFRAKEDEPYSIYLRPADGGDRTESMKLERDESVTYKDVVGQYVVFTTGKKAYASTNGGEKYEAVFSAKPGDEITSAKLSTDGKQFAVATADDQGKGVARSYDLEGKNEKELVTSEKGAVFVHGFSAEKQQLVYSEGCYGCDGPRTAYKLYDIKGKSSKSILEEAKPENIMDMSVSGSMGVIIYVAATPGGNGPGPGVAPYTVYTYSTKDGKTTKITTVGKADEKNPNGTEKFRSFTTGFLAGTDTPYYAEGTDVNIIENNKAALLYQATKPVLFVPYASKDTVVVGAGDTTADYALSSYSLKNKKDTPIFQGDNNTVILGVTTK